MNTSPYINGFVERIKKTLDLVPGESVDAKAKALGTTNASLYAYINGKSLPQTPFLMKLRELTGVNIDWLVSGDGEIKRVGNNAINLDYIELISDKLDDYLENNMEWDGDISHSYYADIVVRIYNFLLYEGFELKDFDHVIETGIALCFGKKPKNEQIRLPDTSRKTIK